MATVTGYTAERMQEIEDAAITSGAVVGDNLVLTRHDGTPITAGNVRGATGPTGPPGGLGEAPINGTIYGRKDAGWTAVPAAGIPDAPSDGTSYARKNAAWAAITSSGALGSLGYARRTSNQSPIGTAKVDLTSLTATVTVGTGRLIRVTGYINMIYNTSGQGGNLYIQEGATQLAMAGSYAAGALIPVAIMVQALIPSPTAGAHTYKLSLASFNSFGVELRAAADNPAFILVEDIGAA